MTAPVAGDARTVLLLLPSKKEMYPLSTVAFTRAQAARRKLASDYQDALILDNDGSLRKFDQIRVLGPWGESIGRRILSRLTDAWRIEVRLSESLPYSLDEIRQVLMDCIVSPQAVDTMRLNNAEVRELVESIRAASSAKQFLQIMNLPEPEDALDVL